jgi:hypothetical protein
MFTWNWLVGLKRSTKIGISSDIKKTQSLHCMVRLYFYLPKIARRTCHCHKVKWWKKWVKFFLLMLAAPFHSSALFLCFIFCCSHTWKCTLCNASSTNIHSHTQKQNCWTEFKISTLNQSIKHGWLTQWTIFFSFFSLTYALNCWS